MIRSETLDALNAALSTAQGEFEAVGKSASNPFFKSAYAPLPEVVKAATPILSKHGLSVWQAGDVDEAGELLWTVVLHKSGQFIGSSARLLPIKNDPQAQGSAVTYQRRYQYMAALGLVADEDDDGNAATTAGTRKPVSRQQTRTRPTTQAKPSDSHSGAEGGSQTGDSKRIDAASLAQLNATYKASGHDRDKLAWMLLSVGIQDLPENPSGGDIGKVMQNLTLEQALKLEALLKGEDDAVPGATV